MKQVNQGFKKQQQDAEKLQKFVRKFVGEGMSQQEIKQSGFLNTTCSTECLTYI